MTDYGAMIDEARAHIEHIAIGVPASQADRVRRGENDDPRTSMLVRLADAVEALVAENGKLRSAENLLAMDAVQMSRVTMMSMDQAAAFIESIYRQAADHKHIHDTEIERDALRAQLDSMTTEWGTGFGGLVLDTGISEDEGRFEKIHDPSVTLIRRQVGPWAEAFE